MKYSKDVMNTKSTRKVKSSAATKRADPFVASALLFLTLGLWLGPSRALFLILVVAALAGWFWLCQRYPITACATLGFLRGLLGR
jgi:hypothetical protein